MADNQRTPRQLDFLFRYMDSSGPTYGNAYASAVAAGYTDSYAKTITTKIPGLSEKIIKKEIVTSDEIIEGIMKETQTERSSDRLKAWELLGKNKKLFTDKVEHDGEVGVVYKVTRGD